MSATVCALINDLISALVCALVVLDVLSLLNEAFYDCVTYVCI